MLAITFLSPLFFSAGAASIWNDIIKIQLDNDCEGTELSTTDMLGKC